MWKYFFNVFFLTFIFIMPNFSLEIFMTPFRFNYYVYYQILYKTQGISPQEFKNIVVQEDTTTKLVFQYDGKTYSAHVLSQGAILVKMPDGLRDRYLSQNRFPKIILYNFDK